MTTTDTAPAAERAAQLAARAQDIQARRASLLADLQDLEAVEHDTARDAHAARPDVAQKRAALAGEVDTLERQRQQALAEGLDPGEVTRRLIAVRVELELADRDLSLVAAMAAQVEAEIAHERRVAEYERLVAAIGEADEQVRAWLSGAEPALVDAVARAEALVDEVLATVAQGKTAAGRAADLRAQAQHLAAQVGRPLPPSVVADPVEAVSQALRDHLPRVRLFLAAARGDRAAVAQGLADNVGR